MPNFIDEYYLNPIRYPTQYAPYNIVNTLTYAVIALAAVYLIFKGLQKLKLHVDEKFYWAVLGFVFFGSFLRIGEDAGLLARSVYMAGLELHPFVTPGIYVLTFVVLAAVYGIWKLARTPNEKLYSRVGWTGKGLGVLVGIGLLANLGGKITTERTVWLAEILGLALLAVLVFELVKTKYNQHEKPELRRIEQATVFSQALDGGATFVGVGIANYGEQHLVANALFQAFGGPIAFYVLKVLFALAVVFIFRKEATHRDEHVYLLLLVSILGLAPGVRDAARIFFGV